MNQPLIFKPTTKYKMNQDELSRHLHLKRKGSSLTKNKKKLIDRKRKHKF